MIDATRPDETKVAAEPTQRPSDHAAGYYTAEGEANMALATNEDAVASPSGLRKKLLLGAVVGGVLVLLSALWILPALTTPAASEGSHHEPREKPSTAIHMKVMKPLPGRERTTTQPASLQSFEFVERYAQVTGVLDKQTVDIGDHVKKGDLLAEIYAPDVVAERARALASWWKAKAEKVQAEKEVEVVENGLEEAKQLVVQRAAELNSAVSYLKFRKAEFIRYKGLLAERAIASGVVDEESDRYDSAEWRKDGAVAGEQTARLDVKVKAARLLKAHADVDEANAAVDVAKALLEKADAFLGFTKITAPFDGVITARNYNNSAFIRTAERGGQVPLLVVKRVDKFRAIVMLPDVDVPFVSKGDRAELVIATIRPKPFVGKVSRTANSEDLKSRTMRVEVDLDNTPDHILKDGMYGYMTIHLKNAPKPKFMLPSRMVHEDLESKDRYVYVIRKNRAHKAVLEVGPDDGKTIGIMAGLNAADLVVIQDNGLLNEDTEVETELVTPPRPPQEKQGG